MLGSVLTPLHAKRQDLLKKSIAALLHSGTASLSGIARGVRSPTALRHRIKSTDRLLGNAGIGQVRHTL